MQSVKLVAALLVAALGVAGQAACSASQEYRSAVEVEKKQEERK